VSRGIRRGERTAISLAEPDVIATGFLPRREGCLPAVLSPTTSGVDLAGWAAGHRDQIGELLARYGAVLFRGFEISSAEGFSAAAAAVAGQLYGDYGDLPREQDADKVFSSTPYPNNLPIHFHNESSHMAKWPMRIFFHCVIAAETGGETPLLDCRALVDQLPADIVSDFDAKGLTYIRNFGRGIDVAWHDFFGTTDRAVVEARCAETGTRCEWVDDDTLRIRQNAEGVRTHPAAGERTFFNQVLLHHPAALPDEVRSAMDELYDADSYPRNVTYGDGSAIPDSVIETLLDVYDEHAVRFPWQAGDMIMLDNMLVSHARSPFTGDRKILVAMSDIYAPDVA
jgi:alpha-ketoglutarate-dependent taurine dioxygenase